MQKTKLGISTGLLAAIVYLAGLAGTLTLIITAGYVLLAEENKWLRKAAVKALAVIVVYHLADGVLSVIDYAFNTINSLFTAFPRVSFRLYWPQNLTAIIHNLLSLLKYLVLVVLGVNAFSQSSIRVAFVDKLVGQHSDTQTDLPYTTAAPICPSCHTPLEPGAAYCTSCGQKL